MVDDNDDNDDTEDNNANDDNDKYAHTSFFLQMPHPACLLVAAEHSR